MNDPIELAPHRFGGRRVRVVTRSGVVRVVRRDEDGYVVGSEHGGCGIGLDYEQAEALALGVAYFDGPTAPDRAEVERLRGAPPAIADRAYCWQKAGQAAELFEFADARAVDAIGAGDSVAETYWRGVARGASLTNDAFHRLFKYLGAPVALPSADAPAHPPQRATPHAPDGAAAGRSAGAGSVAAGGGLAGVGGSGQGCAGADGGHAGEEAERGGSAEAAEGLTGWRLIESAPRTRRVVLLGRHDEHGQWASTRGNWVDEEEIADWDDDSFAPGWFEQPVEGEECYPFAATHWQPLPEPPATGAAVGSGGVA